MNDRLPFKIRDGVRYKAVERRGKNIDGGLEKKRKKGETSQTPSKKQTASYMVIAEKFGAKATEEEMGLDLTEEHLGTEDTFRILQCKIR